MLNPLCFQHNNHHKDTINFVHANGFPAGSYQTFLHYFSDDFSWVAKKQYGHDSQYPIYNNWQYLVDELIHFLEQQQTPVICVGHSFGGVLSFIAACKRPDLVKGLIMLDPPAMTGAIGLAFKLLKKTRYIDKVTPAGKSKDRRSIWPLKTDLNALFSRRQLFKNFDSRCLKDYSDSAATIKNDRLELAFTAKAETAIFRNIPTNLSRFKNKLSVPAALIYGESTDLYPKVFFKTFAKKNKNITLHSTKGGHMFPLENPMETAALIQKIIKGWE